MNRKRDCRDKDEDFLHENESYLRLSYGHTLGKDFSTEALILWILLLKTMHDILWSLGCVVTDLVHPSVCVLRGK